MIPYFAQVQWRNAESTLANRPLYLNATYFSLLTHYPSDNIMVAVQNDADHEFILNSGLKLRAVIKVVITATGFTKLPVAMLKEVIRRIETDDPLVAGIKYVFYCEAGNQTFYHIP